MKNFTFPSLKLANPHSQPGDTLQTTGYFLSNQLLSKLLHIPLHPQPRPPDLTCTPWTHWQSSGPLCGNSLPTTDLSHTQTLTVQGGACAIWRWVGDQSLQKNCKAYCEALHYNCTGERIIKRWYQACRLTNKGLYRGFPLRPWPPLDDWYTRIRFTMDSRNWPHILQGTKEVHTGGCH